MPKQLPFGDLKYALLGVEGYSILAASLIDLSKVGGIITPVPEKDSQIIHIDDYAPIYEALECNVHGLLKGSPYVDQTEGHSSVCKHSPLGGKRYFLSILILDHDLIVS